MRRLIGIHESFPARREFADQFLRRILITADGRRIRSSETIARVCARLSRAGCLSRERLGIMETSGKLRFPPDTENAVIRSNQNRARVSRAHDPSCTQILSPSLFITFHYRTELYSLDPLNGSSAGKKRKKIRTDRSVIMLTRNERGIFQSRRCIARHLLLLICDRYYSLLWRAVYLLMLRY